MAPLTGLPFRYHWYVGEAPMLDELFTLKLTLVPGQIVVAVLDEMLTAGVEAELVKLTVFPVALAVVKHPVALETILA